jgi:hypothetical protein
VALVVKDFKRLGGLLPGMGDRQARVRLGQVKENEELKAADNLPALGAVRTKVSNLPHAEQRQRYKTM